jgi:hypothetical protein
VAAVPELTNDLQDSIFVRGICFSHSQVVTIGFAVIGAVGTGWILTPRNLDDVRLQSCD